MKDIQNALELNLVSGKEVDVVAGEVALESTI